MYVKHRFTLKEETKELLKSLKAPFGYNGFGEFLFYRTYSRSKKNGSQEDWADCAIRVTEGTFSIRKDWYLKNCISWEEDFWQEYATNFARMMFLMKWLPPGRGLWAMGSDFVYERGSMALYNCGYTDVNSATFGDDISWLMDALMCGVGVGFGPVRDDGLKIYKPVGTYDFIIPDTREGWALSTKLKIDAYTKPNQKMPRPIYDGIRGPGELIKGFGGISSGPQPLMDLHKKIDEEFEKYQTRPEYDSVYLKTNLANLTGCAVVAGNVRRSAELCKGKVKDPIFMDLKNYDKFPERESFGWMSNNSVELESDEDFQMLGEIAQRVIRNGEPGYINRRTMPFARIGKSMEGMRIDRAVGFNPCGEIPLEDKELCDLAETLPTNCGDHREWLVACEFACFYASTVSLLPTHQPLTNKVIARNRRIGVGIIDYTGWKHEQGVYKVTQYMREGYEVIKRVNADCADEAGVPHSIRLTTIKPGGTVPKLAGKTAGAGHPTFGHTLRRVRVAKNSPVHPLLVAASVPYEQDYYDSYTDVFEWPIHQGPAVPAEEVSLWEQAFNIIVLQREWSDNAVSNTLYFKPMWQLTEVIDDDFENRLAAYIGHAAVYAIEYKRLTEYFVPERYKIKIRYSGTRPCEAKIYEYNSDHEEKDIEPVLSAIAPMTKSISLLPHSPKGAYRQMPEEGITEHEYTVRLQQIQEIDWKKLNGSDGIDERYCTGPICEIPQ